MTGVVVVVSFSVVVGSFVVVMVGGWVVGAKMEFQTLFSVIFRNYYIQKIHQILKYTSSLNLFLYSFNIARHIHIL